VTGFLPNLRLRSTAAAHRLLIGVLCLPLGGLAHAQTKPAAKPSAEVQAGAAGKGGAGAAAAIKSFRIVQEKDGPAVEILSTRPVVPAIQLINDPTRLVIDLPNARLDTQQKKISVQADQISGLRADQFQQNPPVARVVVDLQAPRTYTWDAAGNRLVVHLGKSGASGHSPFEQQPVAILPKALPPAPVVKAIRAAGPLAIATDAGDVGSSYTAAVDTAVLRLSSGGELRVCPGTTLSITPSQNKHNLMLGINTGALEAHLQLDASSDAVMTPDFRIALVGPGEFHYAFSADNQGNTCVRSLPGNTASAIVTELLGDRTYQVKATDQLMFHGGQLDRVDMAVPLECGCPPPRQTTQQAIVDLPEQSAAQSSARPAMGDRALPPTDAPQPANAATGVPESDGQTTAAAAPNNDLHVQVTAPLVFHATGPPPAPVEDVRALPLESRRADVPDLNVAPAPPVATRTRPSNAQVTDNRPHGFFHKIGNFFASIFR